MMMFVSGMNVISFLGVGVGVGFEFVRPFLIQFAIQWVVGFVSWCIGAACWAIDSYRTRNAMHGTTTPFTAMVM